MSNTVLYGYGLKANYKALEERNPNMLYWLTDSKELYKGDDLYTDGARYVASKENLPPVAAAASGKIYFCRDTGEGYLLNDELQEWDLIIRAIDNDTLGYSEDGLIYVRRVLIENVDGLATRLETIENQLIGGVRYMGSVPTFAQLPDDPRQGDLYEVEADNSEWCWNGTKWFEYGNTNGLKPIARADINNKQFEIVDNTLNIIAIDSGIVNYNNTTIDKMLPRYLDKKYTILPTFDTTNVRYEDHEIRVMFAKDTPFTHQNSGTGSDPNVYYMGLRAYAPAGAVAFKEAIATTIDADVTKEDFTAATAGTDALGRNYTDVWLPVAKYENSAWTYYGATSENGKYPGWYYTVQWFDENDNIIDFDTINISLSNEETHNAVLPYYMYKYAKTEDLEGLASVWQDF